MPPALKSLARAVYAAVPFKRPAYVFLRRVWIPSAALTRHLFFEGPFSVRIEGHDVELSNHSSPHETALFWHGLDGWQERISLRYWIELSKDSAVIVDVGANVGIYSVIAKAVNPAATVWAFEPVERFFHRLVANCARNHLEVKCFDCALSDEDGTAVLWDAAVDHHYHSSLSRADAGPDQRLIERKVPTRTLLSLSSELGLATIDLVKIDVEGWEPEVIEGMGALLQQGKPTILVEIKSMERARRIEDLVAGLGYLFYDIDEATSPRRRPHLAPSSRWNWLLCQPRVAVRLGLPADDPGMSAPEPGR